MPSIFRQLRLATFAFLALVTVGLTISAALTVYEQVRLRAALAEIDRLQEFERVYVFVAERLLAWRHVPASAVAAGRPEIVAQLDYLVTLAAAPETPVLLRTVRLRVAEIGAADSATRVQLDAAVMSERQYGERVLATLRAHTDTQLKLELAAPLAILAVGVLLLPLARRRIIRPLDAFGARLARLAEGDFRPLPLDGVDAFLLPLHRRLNAVAARLQELEAEHAQREQSLEAKVRTASGRLLEQQRALARAERLAATGELAASVAHELRNPLAGIQMTLANLRDELPDPELGARVELVSNEVARLTRLLNSLLDSARHTPEAPRPVALAALVDELFQLCRVELPERIALRAAIDPALTAVVPADRLRQALLNLLLNAGHALADAPGTITVAAQLDAARRLHLSVSDDGPGFPAELLQNGIRPFYSTRAQGTGLGLTMVRRVARELGGDVTLENLAPRGARVTMVVRLDAHT